MNPIQFIVYFPVNAREVYEASPIIQGTGGYLALYLLYSKLKELGYRSDFITKDSLEKLKIYSKILQSGGTIVVYPEAIVDNPLNARHIVRWIMYFVHKETYSKWKNSGDLIICYWSKFVPESENVVEVRPINAVHKLFYDDGEERSGICWRIAKGSEYHSSFNYHNFRNAYRSLANIAISDHYKSLLLDESNYSNPSQLVQFHKLENLQKYFNKYRMFFSYDCESALSVIAALCGCVSIVVPKKNMGFNDLLPSHRIGIAFGYEGIPHALSTMSRLRSHISMLEEYGDRSVMAFASIAFRFFNITND